MMRLTAPLFTVLAYEISGCDLILLLAACSYFGKALKRSGRAWRALKTSRNKHQKPIRVIGPVLTDRDHRYRVFARLGDHGGRYGPITSRSW